MKLCILLLTALLAVSASAETLDEWLADQVRKDERLLADSISQVGGHSLALLKDARTYVPFFLEVPQNTKLASASQKNDFDAWTENSRSGFLPGGYIYRLSFNAAPPLYATSAGNWSGTVWHSLDLGKDLLIEERSVWGGADGDFLYATLLAGAKPRLLVYDEQGEIQRQEVFDASAGDFDQRLEAAVNPYSESNKPILEMISLSEYLNNRDAPWRPVDTSGQFNLRNQHQRPDEKDRLRQSGQLNRAATIDLLQAIQKVPPTPAPAMTPALITPAPAAMSSESPLSTVSESKSSSSFPTVPVAILVVVIVGIALYLLRRKST